MTDMTTCMAKHAPRVRSALSVSPRPMDIEARGAPPTLISAAKAETIMMIGMQTPRPVRAMAPVFGI